MPTDPLVFPIVPTAPQVKAGAFNMPRLDPNGNWYPDEASNQQILRAIYLEMRLQTIVLAEGLNMRPLLDSLRKDMTSVFPSSEDQV